MKINIIGAGKVGKTLARLFVLHRACTIASVYNTTVNNNKNALQFIQQGKGVVNYSELPFADITMITTPDDLIETTCKQLVKQRVLKPSSIIFHTSGSKSSDILASAHELNCKLASIHPMKSFAAPATSVSNFQKTYCALEGDKDAIAIIAPLFTTIGAKIIHIAKEKKTIYHAAGVFSTNFIVTLYQIALQCLLDACVEKTIAKEITLSCMQNAIDNLYQLKSAQTALTGPIKRGDINTVKDHLQTLNDETRTLYKALAEATLKLTSHPDETKQKLKEIIQMTHQLA